MVLKICARLRREIASNQIARCEVHSVYRTTFNLVTPGGRLVSVTPEGKQTMPYGILLDDLAGLRLKPGEQLLLGAAGLSRADRLLLCFADAPSYDCAARLWAALSDAGRMAEKRSILREQLLACGSRDGVLRLLERQTPLEAHQRFVQPLFEEFLTAYRANDLPRITGLGARLCGYGLGLTPYMDDFFCGLMIAAHYTGLCGPSRKKEQQRLVRALSDKLEGRTNLISDQMLWQASEGLCSSGVAELMNALLTEDDAALTARIQRVFQYGSSSGTDICCGLYAGLSRDEKG